MSRRIQSINNINIYEENGIDVKTRFPCPTATIREHWNRKDYVIILIDNQSYTVVAKDLEKAIQNAQNAHS